MKNWYAAKLLFEAEVDGEPSGDVLCEESIRLIEADDEDDARKSAEIVGGRAEHEYVNEMGRTVRWCFRRVLEIQDLCESQIRHGTEVFSTMFRRDHSELSNTSK